MLVLLLSHGYSEHLANLFFTYGNNKMLFTHMISDIITKAKEYKTHEGKSIYLIKENFINKLPGSIGKGGRLHNFF
jgi:hypothetical protein